MTDETSSRRIEHVESETVATVWKVPKEANIDIGDFHDIGIYPSGELMAICESRDEAETLVEKLCERSPSERFGDSMEEAPYAFSIAEEEIYEEVDQ